MLPWSQLLSFDHRAHIACDSELSAALSLLIRLSHPRAALSLRVSSLSIGVCDLGDKEQHVLARTWSCMTLPQLHTLSVQPSRVYFLAIIWPTDQFKRLSSRSSFQHTLRVLQISRIVISEDDLGLSLALLPALERLGISEQREYIILTDGLLRRLTESEPPLIPRLNTLRCDSYLSFTREIYIDFVVSRIGGCSDRNPFEAVLRDRRPITRPGDESSSEIVNVEEEEELDPEPLRRLTAGGRLRFLYQRKGETRCVVVTFPQLFDAFAFRLSTLEVL
ncbi:hypothetical protein FB45DRAFT_1036650 [Roridomyces roridus]|uniref:F-box domain-containing protein n=1 Tax=Roridomyces roridus TaxID=1738132 RepID=A0AAD7B879_9AGAR|nr:hypothetical protein FB45DRAFT_1036650 [Roridomyces roridus]